MVREDSLKAGLPTLFPYCGTNTVRTTSLCPTSDSTVHRMYFQMNSSLSTHGRTFLEEKEDESSHRR